MRVLFEKARTNAHYIHRSSKLCQHGARIDSSRHYGVKNASPYPYAPHADVV